MNKKLILLLSGFVIFIIITYGILTFGGLLKGGITGYQILSTRLVILVENPNECNITMESGWNLVSFPCITTDTGLTLFLLNISNNYDSIKFYDPNSPVDPWKSYSPNLPSWVIQDLSTISRRNGYWIYIENKTKFYLNNSLVTPTLFTLIPGWNLISYPSQTI